MENTTTEMSVAERYYLSHKKSMSEYQKRNKEKVNERNRLYLEKIKDDPERRKAYLEKKRDYYLKITKPKLDAMKQTSTTNAVI